MARTLSLHHLTLLDVDALDLVDIAARTGCSDVSIFVRSGGLRLGFPVVGPSDVGPLRTALAGNGVGVLNLEVFPVDGDVDPRTFRPELEVGAAIGARRLTAKIVDLDMSRAHERFCELCHEAASFHLDVHIEFSAFSSVSTLAAALALLRLGRPPNAYVAVDALHVWRNGVSLADVASARDFIGYIQICDGPLRPSIDKTTEALEERQLPGAGEFDLAGFVNAVPANLPLDIEVPSRSLRDLGLTPLQRARRIVDAARTLVGQS